MGISHRLNSVPKSNRNLQLNMCHHHQRIRITVEKFSIFVVIEWIKIVTLSDYLTAIPARRREKNYCRFIALIRLSAAMSEQQQLQQQQ